MDNPSNYFTEIVYSLRSLCTGLRTTMRELFTRKVTEQYPENRRTLQLPERFRGTLTMPLTNGEHACVACGLCQSVCPNGTIHLETDTEVTPEGKRRKRLVRYEYNLGSCMFCQLCVNACPHGAIAFDQRFEHAVFDRRQLILTLNDPRSRANALT